jgi:hypothetical protein
MSCGWNTAQASRQAANGFSSPTKIISRALRPAFGGGELPIPATAQEGIDRKEELRVVVGIQLKSSGPYPEIVGHRLAPASEARLKECVA